VLLEPSLPAHLQVKQRDEQQNSNETKTTTELISEECIMTDRAEFNIPLNTLITAHFGDKTSLSRKTISLLLKHTLVLLVLNLLSTV